MTSPRSGNEPRPERPPDPALERRPDTAPEDLGAIVRLFVEIVAEVRDDETTSLRDLGPRFAAAAGYGEADRLGATGPAAGEPATVQDDGRQPM